MASLNIIQVMVVRTTKNMGLQKRIDTLNRSITTLQVDGYNIIDIQELNNGSFLIQYRGFN